MQIDVFSKYLVDLRKNANYSQGDVAKLLSFTSQAISKWENGLSLPDLATVQKLAKLYGVDINSFFVFCNAKNDSLADQYEFDTTAFAKRFKELRKLHNYSQSKLAEKIFTTQQTIVKIEKGETTPTIFQFIDMCNLYSISYEAAYYPVLFKLDHPNRTRTILTGVGVGASVIVLALAVALPFIVKPEPITYMVRFYDYDDNVLFERAFNAYSSFEYDSFVSATPNKPDTSTIDYEFIGWDINGDNIVDSIPTIITYSFDARPLFSETSI